MGRHVFNGDTIDDDQPLSVKIVSPDGAILPVATKIAAAGIVPHRSAIMAPDDPNPPGPDNDAVWVLNSGYNNAEINVIGATWMADDTACKPQLQFWLRVAGENPVSAEPQTLTAGSKDDALLTDVGAVTYQLSDVADDGQDFRPAKPVGPGDPSRYLVTAEPSLKTDPPFFGWVDAGGIPQAAKVRTSHFGDDDDSTLGWVGGETPDGSVVSYSVRLPNIHTRFTLGDLAGADVAVTIPAIAGVGDGVGYCVFDVSVRFYG